MKTSIASLSEKEGSWGEDERTRERRTVRRIRGEQARRDVFSPSPLPPPSSPRPVHISHGSEDDFRSPFLSSPLSLSLSGNESKQSDSIVGRLIRSPTLEKLKKKKKPWEIVQPMERGQDVIYENSVDRRVGVGVIVVALEGSREGRGREASN